jgi:hypothetical protein
VSDTAQMEGLLRLNGAIISEGGMRAQAELPAQSWGMSELIDFISERFESQPLREVERSARYTGGETDWSSQEDAMQVEEEERDAQHRGRNAYGQTQYPVKKQANVLKATNPPPPQRGPTEKQQGPPAQKWPATQQGGTGNKWGGPAEPAPAPPGSRTRVQFKSPEGGYKPSDYDWYSALRGIGVANVHHDYKEKGRADQSTSSNASAMQGKGGKGKA